MDNPQGLVHAAADLCGWSARISGKVPLLLPQVGRRYFVKYMAFCRIRTTSCW